MNDVTFKQALQSVMLDNKYDRFVKNRKSGKLDTKGLHRIETTSKLFKRREARKNKHYAVSLVVDCSGSMMGDKMRMAAESAAKLSHHLSKIGISHNIVSFATHAIEIKPFNTKEEPEIREKLLGIVGMGSGEERIFFFWNTKAKDSFPNGKRLFPLLATARGYSEMRKIEEEYDIKGVTYHREDTPSYNSDAEALKFSREQLLDQTGKKLLIFLSDGQPAPLGFSFESPINRGCEQTDFDLKHEVGVTLASGIELYSIGIMHDGVTKYYPPRRTCAIQELSQLYPHIIKLIRLNLRRG